MTDESINFRMTATDLASGKVRQYGSGGAVSGGYGGRAIAGGNLTINFNSAFPPTLMQGHALARAITSELYREWRRQRLI